MSTSIASDTHLNLPNDEEHHHNAKDYVFVDEHNRQKCLKVMRACEGCRRRKIKCDAVTTNAWPCSACIRLKLNCIPPTVSYDKNLNQPQTFGPRPEPLEYASPDTKHLPSVDRDEVEPNANAKVEAGGFTFVTATGPGHFKDRKTMTTVRKRAMEHHLKNSPRPRNQHSRNSSILFEPEIRDKIRDVNSKHTHTPQNETFQQPSDQSTNMSLTSSQQTKMRPLDQIQPHNAQQNHDMIFESPSSATPYAPFEAPIVSRKSHTQSEIELKRHMAPKMPYDEFIIKSLFLVFKNHKSLSPLYRCGISNPAVGPEQLQHHLRNLLKTFANRIAEESKTTTVHLISKTLFSKAHWLAYEIIQQTLSLTDGVVPITKEDDSSGNKTNTSPMDVFEDWELNAYSEHAFADLKSVSDFLETSSAFKVLEMHLSIFAKENSTRPNRLMTLPERQGFGMQGPDTRTSNKIWRHCRKPLCWALLAVGMLEPQIAPFKTRLRWKCKCGENLWSDVEELQAGGVARLIAKMEQHTRTKVSTSPYSTQSGNEQYIAPQPVRWIRDGIAKLTSATGTSNKPAPCLPQHNNNITSPSSTTNSSQLAATQPPTLHLLACMHQNRSRKILQQDRIEAITTDRALLCFMHDQYKRHRGRILHFLSLKSVQGIFFVKFRLPIGGSVDIRHHDPCCIHTFTAQPMCECIPPKDKVVPSPAAEYQCIPGPPATYPPVPPEYLRSLVTCPNDVDEQDTWILSQLPRRVCGTLQGKIGQPADGWGIYYQEGWDFDIIILLVFINFLLASLIFGILWSRLHFDIQGAFGVSAYVATLCAIIVSVIASKAGK